MSTTRSTTRSTAAAATCAALLGAGLALTALPAHAEALTCQGKPVTVEGTTGTPGDDVMVVGSTTVGTATGGAGNDVICIRLTTSREPLLYAVDAGPGDDTVVNESTDANTRLTTLLGAGADTYTGSDTTGEVVVAGAVGWSRLGDTSDVESDTIDTRGGLDIVYSGSTAPGDRNRDAVSTGDGNDILHWAGEQVGNPVDLGAGTNSLALHPGWQGTSAVVDAAQQVATVDSRPALRWTGEVTSFELRLDNLETTFTGTDADERLLAATPVVAGPGGAAPTPDPAQRRWIDMAGGDDHVELWDTVGGTMIGGTGRDTLDAGYCFVADVTLGSRFTCVRSLNPRVDHTAVIDAWEDVSVPGNRVHVVGSAAPDTIDARGNLVRVSGRGGDDLILIGGPRGTSEQKWPTVVRGGDGDDRISGSFNVDKILGGGGRDRVWASGKADLVLGGSGRDRLSGGKGPDRLFGGAGRDKATGEAGRDRCAAEVRRSCERS